MEQILRQRWRKLKYECSCNITTNDQKNNLVKIVTWMTDPLIVDFNNVSIQL